MDTNNNDMKGMEEHLSTQNVAEQSGSIDESLGIDKIGTDVLSLGNP